MAKRSAGEVAGGLVILIVAGALVIAILIGATPAMTRLTSLLGAATTENVPLMETLFNALVFGAILVTALVGGALDRRNAIAFGPRAATRLPVGLAIGLMGISVTTFYAKLAGTLVPGAGGGAAMSMLVWGAAVVLLQTLAEEVYFRGWLQPSLGTRWGLAPALVATALVFAGLHVAGGARAPVSLVNLFLGGLAFGLLAARGGGIAAALGAHFGWNATEQFGYGLDPNPGVGSFGSVRDWDLVGPGLWGGSPEGLNASLGMTFVLLAIVVPLAMLSWRSLFGGVHPATTPRVAAVI